MHQPELNRNEPPDDIDRLFQLNEANLPAFGRVFDDTLKALRAETESAFITPPAKRPRGFRWPSGLAAFTGGGLLLGLFVFVTVWLVAPEQPPQIVTSSSTQVAAAANNEQIQPVLPDGSRSFPQYLDYTLLAREAKVENAPTLTSSLLVPKLDTFGDNTAFLASQNNFYRRQMR